MEAMNCDGESSELPQDKFVAEMKSFYDSAPPLKDGDDINYRLKDFIGHNLSALGNGSARNVVCVTSGGTTVPLEKRCVRYIDNFSSGHRGSASTEYFIKAGYAVIFLYRRGSCQPYCRFLPDDPLLNCLEFINGSTIQVRDSYSEAVNSAVSHHCSAIAGNYLLKLPFTTIFEYLQTLQLIATSMRSLGRHAMFYLAAAVSDFYVPWKTMSEHKIQSNTGPLDMRLVQVPKLLMVLRTKWAPEAFCISFKLETDLEILLEKADAALRKYDMHMVIANELLTRKEKVVAVTPNCKISVNRDRQLGSDVEKPLVDLISCAHFAYIENSC